MKPEELLAVSVSKYLRTNHPNIPFRFDQIDQVSMRSGKRNKLMHGKWSRGYPDLFIATCKRNKKGKIKYGGLYLELKATKTVHNTAHTREQAAYHAVLRHHGYKASFVCGFEEAVKEIEKYLSN